jgi:hypothetical protein
MRAKGWKVVSLSGLGKSSTKWAQPLTVCLFAGSYLNYPVVTGKQFKMMESARVKIPQKPK